MTLMRKGQQTHSSRASAWLELTACPSQAVDPCWEQLPHVEVSKDAVKRLRHKGWICKRFIQSSFFSSLPCRHQIKRRLEKHSTAHQIFIQEIQENHTTKKGALGSKRSLENTPPCKHFKLAGFEEQKSSIKRLLMTKETHHLSSGDRKSWTIKQWLMWKNPKGFRGT